MAKTYPIKHFSQLVTHFSFLPALLKRFELIAFAFPSKYVIFQCVALTRLFFEIGPGGKGK
jgi:hypothetical protein